jgi:hypothetical protein
MTGPTLKDTAHPLLIHNQFEFKTLFDFWFCTQSAEMKIFIQETIFLAAYCISA